MRTLFRDLATALHPDKVQDEDEKARRTEAMKEISGAYEDGDLARMLDLKRIWLAGGVAPASGDEIDRQRANLERTNTALRVQLKDLTQNLKELRRSPLGQMLKDILSAAHGRGEDPIAALVAGANVDLSRAREVRDFVLSFRDGRITIDEFVRGPQSMRADHLPDDERDADEESFDAFLEALFGPSSEASSRSRGCGRRPSKRGRRSADVPF